MKEYDTEQLKVTFKMLNLIFPTKNVHVKGDE